MPGNSAVPTIVGARFLWLNANIRITAASMWSCALSGIGFACLTHDNDDISAYIFMEKIGKQSDCFATRDTVRRCDGQDFDPHFFK
jgi:hypothetical protein